MQLPDLNKVYDSDGQLIFNGTYPKLGDLGERDFSKEYSIIFGTVAAAAAVLLLLVVLMFCRPACGVGALCCECCDGDRGRADKELDGFHESLFLVLRDCVTCCKVREKEPRAAHVRADGDFHPDRGGGASSPQKNTAHESPND